MFSSIKRGARLAAVVGISATVVVGLAGPAFADATNNQAIGIRTGGLIVAGPFAQANFPAGPATDTLLTVDVPTLLGSGTIVTNAGANSADASVENLAVTLSGLATLNAGVVTSECSYDPQTAQLTGSAELANANVTILSGLPIPLPPIVLNLDGSPAPNTVVSVPGVAQIVLNRQVLAPNGTLTVDAIYINILSGTQTVRVATSHCHPATLVVPTIAPPFAAGAAVLGLMGLGFFLYRRRQTATSSV